ncbi:MAG TPA: hypothetical protein V6C58_23475 [Allocoleopsis sp.]
MTKEAYFELCEALGSEPLEHEIPMEFEDFPYEVQLAFTIYWKLKDQWEGFSGTYMGKDYSALFSLFNVFDIEKYEYKVYYDLIDTIDMYRSKLINEKHKQNSKNANASGKKT